MDKRRLSAAVSSIHSLLPFIQWLPPEAVVFVKVKPVRKTIFPSMKLPMREPISTPRSQAQGSITSVMKIIQSPVT